jgi:hypothetical protein
MQPNALPALYKPSQFQRNKSEAMRKLTLLLPVFLLFFFHIPCELKAQTKAEIQNIDFNVVNDSLIVTYDLLKAKSSERFTITLIVKTVTGKTYDLSSLRGDVGNNIGGGKGKRIVWDITKDKAVINDDIFVQVLATPVQAEPGAQPAQQPPATAKQPKAKASGQGEGKGYSKGAAIGLSVVVPGLGITKLRNGGAYWLIGVATYGCAITGLVLDIMCSSTYNKYKNATTASDRDKYFKSANSQNKTGNLLLYTAAGLWAVDLIITAVVPSKPRNKFSMGPTYDPLINKPMLTLRYRIGK